MKAQSNGPAPSENEQTLLMYGGFKVAYEEINGQIMVNATQMAKPFDKRPVDWLVTQQSKDSLNAIAKVRNLTLADLKQVRRGGNNSGTLFHDEAALIFAQWLSPEFYVLCNQALKKALQGKLIAFEALNGVTPYVKDGLPYYHYLEALKSLGRSTTSGAVAQRKMRYRNHYKTFFNQNFITGELFRFLIAEKELEERKQLMMSNQLNLSL